MVFHGLGGVTENGSTESSLNYLWSNTGSETIQQQDIARPHFASTLQNFNCGLASLYPGPQSIKTILGHSWTTIKRTYITILDLKHVEEITLKEWFMKISEN